MTRYSGKLKGYLFVIILALLLIIYNLFIIQIKRGNYYKNIADNNRFRKRRVEPVRGNIYDRNYLPLVINKPSINFYIIPNKIDDIDRYTKLISDNFPLSEKKIFKEIKKSKKITGREILIAHNIPYESFIKIAEMQNYYPAIFFKNENSRNYLINSHFLGYIRNINAQEFTKFKQKEYSLNSSIGKLGIEKQYEKILRGQVDYKIYQRDALGNNLDLLKYSPDETRSGKSLLLTIDKPLQTYITKMFKDTRHKGFVGVMNANTGGILAYVSIPQYDNNKFTGPFSHDDWQELISDSLNPILDRGIGAVYPPASTFKLITASLGLEENILSQDTKLEKCIGYYKYGGNISKCWYAPGHGSLSVVGAIQQSCDVFFYDLSLRLNLENFRQFTKENMLTIKTGIDIPGEVSGFFPSEIWYKNKFSNISSWQGFKINLAIGQGEVLTTPIQVLSYFAAIGNNGLWRRPHFLMQVIGGQKKPSTKGINLPISPSTLEIMQQALFETVNGGKKATGKFAKLRDPVMYGKTGTAQNHMSEVPHLWFAGYSKFRDPDLPTLAYVVFLENTQGGGGSVCAPISRNIISYYSKILRERSK